MNICYCTIITSDFLLYPLALNQSLLRYNAGTRLSIFVVDKTFDKTVLVEKYPNIDIYFQSDLITYELTKDIYEKYFEKDIDCFRWSMKPVFIKHLLEQGYDQVFFLDPDLFFFSDYKFLSESLAGNRVLLTPHWRSSSPQEDPLNFSTLLTSGLFNAGFVGVSRDGLEVMDWWAELCANKCVKNPAEGHFVDQAYLNLFPIYFDRIKIERHRGCNVANWNMVECKRTPGPDGTVKINKTYDIVFIHFTKSTIIGINSGEDGYLRPYLKIYTDTLERFRIELTDLLSYNSIDGPESTTTPVPLPVPDSSAFLSPILTSRQLDRYHVRTSILEALQAILGRFEGTLLDVGCGQMPYKTLLTKPPSRVTRYIGLDLESNPIYENQPDITWLEGRIPLDSNIIDCTICTEVLEHSPEPEAVLTEIHRVLKPGGLLFFTVPFLWPLHDVPYDEYRYTPFSLRRHLTASGFGDIEIRAMGGWDASLAQMLGLWVRRRPMKGWARALLSYGMFPFVRYLFFKDKKNKVNFMNSTMITGISGIAKKQ